MAEEPLLQTWTSVATRKVMMCKGMYNAASSVYDVMINALMATVVAKLKLFRSICHQMGQEPFHLCNLFSQKSICHKCCNTQQVPPVVDATLECLDRVNHTIHLSLFQQKDWTVPLPSLHESLDSRGAKL